MRTVFRMRDDQPGPGTKAAASPFGAGRAARDATADLSDGARSEVVFHVRLRSSPPGAATPTSVAVRYTIELNTTVTKSKTSIDV